MTSNDFSAEIVFTQMKCSFLFILATLAKCSSTLVSSKIRYMVSWVGFLSALLKRLLLRKSYAGFF
jgi:hypothetical protein